MEHQPRWTTFLAKKLSNFRVEVIQIILSGHYGIKMQRKFVNNGKISGKC